MAPNRSKAGAFLSLGSDATAPFNDRGIAYNGAVWRIVDNLAIQNASILEREMNEVATGCRRFGVELRDARATVPRSDMNLIKHRREHAGPAP